jgi:hypothetical protein
MILWMHFSESATVATGLHLGIPGSILYSHALSTRT